MRDLRSLMFANAEWYEALRQPDDDSPSAWYVAKSPDHWAVALLSAAAGFARDHGLLEVFRAKFAGIRPQDLAPERATVNRRSVSSPIWVIAHELVVARYLEGVLGWTYQRYEPEGDKTRRGDWEFRSREGRVVFVEVKTIEELELSGSTGVYSRPVHSARIRDVVKGAYKQLPDDDRATLVVLVGREILSVSHGILFTDLCQTMFGQCQVRFKAFAEDADYRAGPAFKDMLVHGTKHRRIGCIAGMRITGMDIPHVRFYAIDNPFASPGKRPSDTDLDGALRLMVDAEGVGREKAGLSLEETWVRMAERE